MDFLMGKWPLLKKGGVTVAKEGLKKGEMGMGGSGRKRVAPGSLRFPPDHSSIPCHHPEKPHIVKDDTASDFLYSALFKHTYHFHLEQKFLATYEADRANCF